MQIVKKKLTEYDGVPWHKMRDYTRRNLMSIRWHWHQQLELVEISIHGVWLRALIANELRGKCDIHLFNNILRVRLYHSKRRDKIISLISMDILPVNMIQNYDCSNPMLFTAILVPWKYCWPTYFGLAGGHYMFNQLSYVNELSTHPAIKVIWTTHQNTVANKRCT